MDFEKIRYFLTLADTLSYTKAAQQLYISQSMLSRHIKSLESELGVVLFSRNTHGVALTPAGVFMANGLRSINSEYTFLLDQAKNTTYGVKESLRIGVLVSGALRTMADLLIQYEQLHPGLGITFVTLHSPDEIYHELIKNSIDVALSVGIPSLTQRLTSVDLCSNRLCIFMSNRNHLASLEDDYLSIHQLRDQTFITPADTVSTAYKELIIRCDKAGFSPKVIAVPDILSVALMIELNHGISFFHEYSIFNGYANLTFKYLRGEEPQRKLTLYSNPNNADPKVLAFLDYVREKVQSSANEAR